MQEAEPRRKKRIRRDPEDARLLILATAEDLMRQEGYAAVTVRRVAKQAGLSSALLHYYYPTLDDLLVALYKHTASRDLVLLGNSLTQVDPISSLWDYQTNSDRTALGVEFLALANHKKVVKAEIAKFATHMRQLQAQAIATILPTCASAAAMPSPECIATLLTSISRNLIMEGAVGITLGHSEAKALVEHSIAVWLRRQASPDAM